MSGNARGWICAYFKFSEKYIDFPGNAYYNDKQIQNMKRDEREQ
ncbi:hypothetical protein KNP414_00602 [Paenibacillus mucilaginosus KNP414]|uniref:Uncharacterized protein n=1 Tax=Paenibacillus mucilaginosus (strain KNP414) TaxID=1036673 RepID=F8FQE5_PAEMK|nr:hypothetical protein KNP414_00602 [Paenibacillus mucilaginosus KNP414]